MDIEGKVALVTGGGSGIGRASAVRLAREGASVVIADMSEPGARETITQIEAAGGKASFVHADVSSVADARVMIAFAEDTYGGLDILHNNAGIITRPPRWPDTDPEQLIRMIDINLRGVVLGTQAAIPAMRRRGQGAIVNTASLAGIGYGFPPNPVYAATKGGVVLFTASLAPLKDEANIRVNCVCPGVVDTPMLRGASEGNMPQEAQITADRLRSLQIIPPEEIADAVVELIRDESLAGRALIVPNARPRELVRLPAPRE
jgi:NAD(P)-dependent dehydrogenase (short-subunit alcohol dehydrogenase family)